MEEPDGEKEEYKALNFIEQIVEEDLKSGKHTSIHTRFPPEPNGYLHIGHAKSICLNFGLAKKYNGKCNLRFDDTNPSREEQEYVDSIKEDVRWLGWEWDDREFYASDYFETLYRYAVKLIEKGRAFVCDLSAEEISSMRGNPGLPATPSPYRDRSVQENLELFTRMRTGELPDGSHVLRAKIDLSSPNMHMRDPVLYRIMHAHHHRTGDNWAIYPMYDFAHGQSDSLEGITHSICTLEFEVHRPLYEWFIRELEIFPSRQIEFARLNLTYTVMSKRKLLELVTNNYVNGWDDPRMPTISGLRRRGYTPESIRNFADKVGVAKRDNMIDIALLEHCLREDLNRKALRLLTVMNPLKLVIDNYPEGQGEELDAVNNPEDPSMGTRKVPFSQVLYIEQEDFMEDPPKKFFRLAPGNEVRLRYAYFVKCVGVVKDENGQVTEVHCTYDPASRGGNSPDGRKVQGTIHWVSVQDALECEARLYDHLFIQENPDDSPEGVDYKDLLNPGSLKVTTCYSEPYLAECKAGDKIQFERIGYFCIDPDSSASRIVVNRTVSLRDSWAKNAGNPQKA